MKLEIYPELCCDYCNEVVHNHINCPVCKDGYAETDAYRDLHPWNDDEDTIIECECGAKFKRTSSEGSYDGWEWEQI